VTTGEGGAFSFALDDLPVAEFYRRLFEGAKGARALLLRLEDENPNHQDGGRA
jgi:hypothetical protein